MPSRDTISRVQTLLSSPVFDYLKSTLFLYVVFTRSVQAQRHLRARGLVPTVTDFWRWLSQVSSNAFCAFRTFSSLTPRYSEFYFWHYDCPQCERKSNSSLGKRSSTLKRNSCPREKASQDICLSLLLAIHLNGFSRKWRRWTLRASHIPTGNMANFPVPCTVRSCTTIVTSCLPKIVSFGLIDGGDDLCKVIVSAFERYCVSNPLHPDVFPAIRKMEAEIVAMCLRLYNNPDGAGVTTSGGTESIIMSVKTHRDWARATKGITEPEMYVWHSKAWVSTDFGPQRCARVCACCVRQRRSISQDQGPYHSCRPCHAQS